MLDAHHIKEELFPGYLQRELPPPRHGEIKRHLDTCPACWNRWNQYRWEQAKQASVFTEFQAFLEEQGEPLRDAFDSSKALQTAWQCANPQTPAERAAFFRRDTHYLYNLVIWHASGQRPPYIADAIPVLKQYQARRICDFGCGIGSDGLQLMEHGFQTTFCEYDNSSSRFLRWRLQRRQMHAPWLEPGDIGRLRDIDTLWAIDVLDHLSDLQELAPLLDTCRLLCFENDSQHKAHGGPSFHIRRPQQVLTEMLTRYRFTLAHTTPLIAIWQKE